MPNIWKQRGSKKTRLKIGKSFFVPVLLKVISTNPDGTPRWLEICGDEETIDLEHGSRSFYLVWASERLAWRAGQSGANTQDKKEPCLSGCHP